MELTPKTRKETFLAAAAGQDVTTPTPITREEVFLDEIAKGGGGGGSSLPSVTSADNGKVLGVVDGAWAASEQGKKFIVTLTPTALDYSGTMDKTVAEIWDAHNSGQDIVFRFMMSETEYNDVIPNLFEHLDGISYGVIVASAIIGTDTFAEIRTEQSASDGTVNNYYFFTYTLTPAS